MKKTGKSTPQQQLDQMTRERDRFQSLFTVTHEIAISMDLDRVVQSALNGALKTTRADAGALLILDRESGLLLPRAKVDWPMTSVELRRVPEDWTQGWRDDPIRPIGDIAALPTADWQAALQIPPTIAGLITASIIANGEFYVCWLSAPGKPTTLPPTIPPASRPSLPRWPA